MNPTKIFSRLMALLLAAFCLNNPTFGFVVEERHYKEMEWEVVSGQFPNYEFKARPVRFGDEQGFFDGTGFACAYDELLQLRRVKRHSNHELLWQVDFGDGSGSAETLYREFHDGEPVGLLVLDSSGVLRRQEWASSGGVVHQHDYNIDGKVKRIRTFANDSLRAEKRYAYEGKSAFKEHLYDGFGNYLGYKHVSNNWIGGTLLKRVVAYDAFGKRLRRELVALSNNKPILHGTEDGFWVFGRSQLGGRLLQKSARDLGFQDGYVRITYGHPFPEGSMDHKTLFSSELFNPKWSHPSFERRQFWRRQNKPYREEFWVFSTNQQAQQHLLLLRSADGGLNLVERVGSANRQQRHFDARGLLVRKTIVDGEQNPIGATLYTYDDMGRLSVEELYLGMDKTKVLPKKTILYLYREGGFGRSVGDGTPVSVGGLRSPSGPYNLGRLLWSHMLDERLAGEGKFQSPQKAKQGQQLVEGLWGINKDGLAKVVVLDEYGKVQRYVRVWSEPKSPTTYSIVFGYAVGLGEVYYGPSVGLGRPDLEDNGALVERIAFEVDADQPERLLGATRTTHNPKNGKPIDTWQLGIFGVSKTKP